MPDAPKRHDVSVRISSTLMKYRFLLMAGVVSSAAVLPHLQALSQTLPDGRIIVAETVEDVKKKKAKEDAKPQPKPEPKAQPKPEPKPQIQPKPEPKLQPKPEPKPQPKPEPKAQPKPEPKLQPKPEPKAQPKPELRPEPKAQPKVDPKPLPKVDPKPQVLEKKGPGGKQDPVTTQQDPTGKQLPKGVGKAPDGKAPVGKVPVGTQDPVTTQQDPTGKQLPKGVGKGPDGKGPVGKGPDGKGPVGKGPEGKQDPVTTQQDPTGKQLPKGVGKGPDGKGPGGKQDPATTQQQQGGPGAPQTQQGAGQKGPVAQPKFVPAETTKNAEPKGGFAKGNVDQVKGQRKVEVVGGQRIIIEPGNRRIIREGNRVIIRHDEADRMRRWGNARVETRGRERFTIQQRGPYQIVTVTDANGRMSRRYRRYPDGREYVFIDNRPRFGRAAVGVGVAALALGLAAPVISMPRNRYIVDAGQAPPALLYETLDAPPVTEIERPYSLDEVRYNVELRDRMRSVDLNTINFSTGSWEVAQEQYPQLQALAGAILKVLSENPDSVFMLEGHTDSVGPDEDNLSLSDRRAEAVAEILTGQFQVPPENLVTQGYGEQHLRVQVDGPSRENRRVVLRNITPLLGAAQAQDPAAQQQPQDPG